MKSRVVIFQLGSIFRCVFYEGAIKKQGENKQHRYYERGRRGRVNYYEGYLI